MKLQITAQILDTLKAFAKFSQGKIVCIEVKDGTLNVRSSTIEPGAPVGVLLNSNGIPCSGPDLNVGIPNISNFLSFVSDGTTLELVNEGRAFKITTGRSKTTYKLADDNSKSMEYLKKAIEHVVKVSENEQVVSEFEVSSEELRHLKTSFSLLADLKPSARIEFKTGDNVMNIISLNGYLADPKKERSELMTVDIPAKNTADVNIFAYSTLAVANMESTDNKFTIVDFNGFYFLKSIVKDCIIYLPLGEDEE